MNPADRIDGGVTTPRRLPTEVDAAVAYLADALVHTCWTSPQSGVDMRRSPRRSRRIRP
jgi:hypothetical protein